MKKAVPKPCYFLFFISEQNRSIYNFNLLKFVVETKLTREGFFKKKHSCGFIFSKLCYTPIFLIHVHIFSIK